MTIPQQLLSSICDRAIELPSGRYAGVDAREEQELFRIEAADLTDVGYEQHQAESAVAGLRNGDLKPLADVLEIALFAKFKVWCDRRGDGDETAKLRVEGQLHCDWLKEYLIAKFPGIQPSDAEEITDTPVWSFLISFSNNVTPFRLRKELAECQQIQLMRNLVVYVDEQPHYTVNADNLASWLEDQSAESWWTVDGDVSLGSRVSFPCPSDELAREIRRIGRSLLLVDPAENPDADGQEIVPDELSRIVGPDEWGNRLLHLCWVGDKTGWEVIEEEAISGSVSEV